MKSALEEVTGIKLQNKPRQAVLKANGKLEPIEYNDQIVEVIRCNECNIEHLVHENSYIEMVGNLHVGGKDRGGLLGNGDWKNIGVPVYHFCINNRCLSNYIRKTELEELVKIGHISKIEQNMGFEVGVPVYIDNEQYFKPDNPYHISGYGVLGGVLVEGRVFSMTPSGEYVKPMRVEVKPDQIQEWMVKGIVQVTSDTVAPDPNQRP